MGGEIGRDGVWSGTGSAGLRMGMGLRRQSACTGGQLSRQSLGRLLNPRAPVRLYLIWQKAVATRKLTPIPLAQVHDHPSERIGAWRGRQRVHSLLLPYQCGSASSAGKCRQRLRSPVREPNRTEAERRRARLGLAGHLIIKRIRTLFQMF
jgi:hypothetical protein